MISIFFAISISAEPVFALFNDRDFIDLSKVSYVVNSSGHFTLDVTTSTAVVNGELIGIITQSSPSFRIVGFVNAYYWRILFEEFGVGSSADLENLLYYIEEKNFISDMGYIGGYFFENPEEVYSTYLSYISYIESPTYDDGYADGLVEGAENFIKSDTYKESLEFEKDLGRSEGKAEFIASDEYQTLLDEEYDRGLKDGAEEDGGSVFYTVLIGFFGVSTLLIVLVTVFKAIFSKRFEDKKNLKTIVFKQQRKTEHSKFNIKVQSHPFYEKKRRKIAFNKKFFSSR